MGRQIIDITNRKFGRLIVEKRSNKISNSGDIVWQCKCNCGNIAYATGADLRRGRNNYCSECKKEKSKLSPIKGLYGNYKRSALKRNYEFQLSLEQFSQLIKQKCHYCNSEPSQYYKKENAKEGIFYNGVDRKNNKIGYTIINSVPCCKFCNLAKSKFPLEEFTQWLERIKVK